MLKKGLLWERATAGCAVSSICKVMLVQHSTLASKVHQLQDCPQVCETHGILLQVCSLSHSSGQDESPEGTAWLQELHFVLAPWGGICFSPPAWHPLPSTPLP